MKSSAVSIVAGLVALLSVIQLALGQTPSSAPVTRPPSASSSWAFENGLSLGFAIPLTGSPNLTWEHPVSDRLTLASEFAYFDRNWVKILEPADWHSRSGYLGTMLKYYPARAPGAYTGYWIGMDGGLAISYQTYQPLDESDIFFFPYLDFYVVAYTLPVRKGLYLEAFAGGGWAPVGSIVKIAEHAHDTGDWYPIADIRVTYRW